MKKFLSITIILVLAFLLVACSSQSEAAKNVDDLIKAIGTVTVESETAILAAEQAYNALVDEEKAEVKNYEKLLQARQDYIKAVIVGDWVIISTFNLDKNETFTFNSDGTFNVSNAISGAYIINDSAVEIGVKELGFNVNGEIITKNGITYLIIQNSQYVKGEDTTYSEIAITNDNWMEYFKVEQKDYVQKNAFGELDTAYKTYELILKDEYKERLVRTYSQDKIISVEFEYKFAEKIININDQDQIVVIGNPAYSYSDTKKEVKNITMHDLIYEAENGAPYGRSVVYQSSHKYDGVTTMYIPEEPTILRVAGTLLLHDKPIHK